MNLYVLLLSNKEHYLSLTVVCHPHLSYVCVGAGSWDEVLFGFKEESVGFFEISVCSNSHYIIVGSFSFLSDLWCLNHYRLRFLSWECL